MAKYIYIRNLLRNTNKMAYVLYGFPVVYMVDKKRYKVLIKKRQRFFKTNTFKR